MGALGKFDDEAGARVVRIYQDRLRDLASSEEVTLDTEWTGSRTFFSREGLFMLQASGTGIVIL